MRRSREYAGNVADVAEWGLLNASALQRRLRKINVEHPGKDSCPACEDGSLLPVSYQFHNLG